MPFASINGIELYYEVHGQGPALVLAHGGGGSHLSWWQQVPAFSDSFSVITFDHRSFGLSRDVPDGPGPEAFVQDLVALLDHLEVEKAVLAGQSMGGWTVCGFAAAHPQRTNGLILCDTLGGIETDQTAQAQAGIRERSRGSLAELLKNAYSPTFPQREPVLTFLYQQIVALNMHVAPNLGTALFSLKADPRPIVEHRIPTLLIVGEEDVLTPPPAMQSVAAQLPHARFITVPGCGHSVYFERADEFNRLVGSFLREQVSA